MSARVYSIADAYAERARDYRLAAYRFNDAGDWQSADACQARSRDLENRVSYARRGVRVIEGARP